MYRKVVDHVLNIVAVKSIIESEILRYVVLLLLILIQLCLKHLVVIEPDELFHNWLKSFSAIVVSEMKKKQNETNYQRIQNNKLTKHREVQHTSNGNVMRVTI